MPVGIYERTKKHLKILARARLFQVHTRISARDKFEKYVIRKNGCWGWRGAKDSYGYGSFFADNKLRRSNQWAYLLFVGEIPDGVCVCHKCNNPECTNPEHLYLATKVQNIKDAWRDGLCKPFRKSHCIKGHKFTKKSVRVYKVGKYLQRYCIACEKERRRLRWITEKN